MASFADDRTGLIAKDASASRGALCSDSGESLGRFYFDRGRSRVFLNDGQVFDFSWWFNKHNARLWCAVQGYEFIDNSIDRLPGSCQRAVLGSRKAGSEKARHIAAFPREGYDYEKVRSKRTTLTAKEELAIIERQMGVWE